MNNIRCALTEDHRVLVYAERKRGRPALIDANEALALYEQDMTYNQIAIKYGVSYGCAYNTIQRNGGTKKNSQYDFRQIFKLHDEGINCSQIAQIMEIGYQTVAGYLKRKYGTAAPKNSPMFFKREATNAVYY